MIRVLRAAMVAIGFAALFIADALAEHDEEPTAVLARYRPRVRRADEPARWAVRRGAVAMTGLVAMTVRLIWVANRLERARRPRGRFAIDPSHFDIFA